MSIRRITTLAACAALALSSVTGCSGAMDTSPSSQTGSSSNEEDDSGNREIVTPGKADNYWSNVSKEYELEGTVDVQMSEEDFNSEAIRNRKVTSRTTAVGLYLTAYLTEKLEEYFDNMEYGGFQSMVRNQSVEKEDISEVEEGTYRVTFTIDVAGPPDLLQRLLREGAESTDEGIRFSMEMPKGATSDPGYVNRRAPRNFNPAEEPDEELETIPFEAAPLPTQKDSYPHYESFVQDGTYDITVFFGHDYNEDRWDIRTAKEVFRTLQRSGFGAPVASFDELKASSGPFTKTMRAPGVPGTERVQIEVRLFHSDMYEGERDQHKDRAIEELRERDVFYYWGHAGPYAGFSFSPNDQADLGYTEIEELELKEKNQLVIASGCQTYSQYADMLYANPAKSEENLDVMTTVNYSNLAAGDAILTSLVRTEGETHQPTSFYELVRQINAPRATRRMDTFYGVIGLEGNPQLHPYANAEAIGRSCQSNADCGSHSNANLCVDGSCAVRALSEGACPSGAQFGYVGQGDQMESGVCY